MVLTTIRVRTGFDCIFVRVKMGCGGQCQEPNDTAATTTAVAEIAGREAANDVDLSRLLVFWFVLSQVTYCFFGQSSSAEIYRR